VGRENVQNRTRIGTMNRSAAILAAASSTWPTFRNFQISDQQNVSAARMAALRFMETENLQTLERVVAMNAIAERRTPIQRVGWIRLCRIGVRLSGSWVGATSKIGRE